MKVKSNPELNRGTYFPPESSVLMLSAEQLPLCGSREGIDDLGDSPNWDPED